MPFIAASGTALPESIEPQSNEISKDLAEHWPDFVNCKERLKSEETFLRKIFDSFYGYEDRREVDILDVSAGIGCESIFLAKAGFSVVSNEINDDLGMIAMRRARENDVESKIIWRRYNWLEMGYQFDKKFEVILILGNCLSMILNQKDRSRAMDQFYKILKPGGMLIVDVRNFEKIKKHKDEIKKNPDIFYEKLYSAKHMYCGKHFKGWPDKFDEQFITFAYGTSTQNIIRNIKMYPLGESELEDLLNARFDKFQKYYDLSSEADENADFFTYVAIKSRT
jgi:glycine/sarcosine N-methyltransferase